MRNLLRNRRAKVCIGFLLLVIVASMLVNYLSPHNPQTVNGDARFLPPGKGFLMGTDEFGRDLFGRVFTGAKLTLGISFFSMLLASVLGIALGIVAGFYRGFFEKLIMRLIDITLCFPPIVVAIFVVSFFGSSAAHLICVIGLLYVPRVARVVYSSTLTVREMQHVEASKSMGASNLRIMLINIFPNILAPAVVQFSLGMGHAVLMESGLSFLGLGPAPPAITWGRMVQQSARFMDISFFPVLWPSLLICLTILAFNILGDVLRDSMDPRLKSLEN
ncbi:MAG: ABC transporter permease [Eubacteriales bacterium]|jgi:peptide/nickel transport system permease protein|nr:ABC transporter permease [Eubacteriales bacterium]